MIIKYILVKLYWMIKIRLILSFETKELVELMDESNLNFEVTNNSSQYDAEVKFMVEKL